MSEAQTASVKYVFLDVEGYSSNRSVEAQVDIIGVLNTLIAEALRENGILEKSVILLPTGDGLCIALIEADSQFDVHMLIALDILARLSDHNGRETDEMRKFRVRIGINANVDNIVVDINGRKNVAGAGINLAQRVMSLADGNQILVSDNVYETLRHREKYMRSFKSYSAVAKHNLSLGVHQFVEKRAGLDTTTPIRLKDPQPQKAVEKRPSKLVAYYIAHAIKNKKVLKQAAFSSDAQAPYAATVLLFFLAQDSVDKDNSGDLQKPTVRVEPHDSTFQEQLAFYCKEDFWVIASLNDSIQFHQLSQFSDHFDHTNISMQYHFVNAKGAAKLKEEWPKIWNEFGL